MLLKTLDLLTDSVNSDSQMMLISVLNEIFMTSVPVYEKGRIKGINISIIYDITNDYFS